MKSCINGHWKQTIEALEGCIVAHITPIKAQRLDVPGLETLLDHIISGGAQGILVNGSNAEFSKLLPEDRTLVARTAIQKCTGKMNVYINMTDTSIARVKQNIDAVDGLSYDAVVVALPYYFVPTNREEQLAYFRAVCDLCDKPVILYNIPGNIGAAIDLSAVKEMSNWPNVIGIKDSGSDENYRGQLLCMQNKDTFRVILGREKTCAEYYRRGAFGCVNSLGNIYPEVFVAQYKAAKLGNWELVDKIQTVINRVNAYSHQIESATRVMYARKLMLHSMGICGTEMMEPFAGTGTEFVSEMMCITPQITETIHKLLSPVF